MDLAHYIGVLSIACGGNACGVKYTFCALYFSLRKRLLRNQLILRDASYNNYIACERVQIRCDI